MAFILADTIDKATNTETIDYRPQIIFNVNENEGLKIDVWTEKLHLRSVQLEDLEDYVSLYEDPKNVEKYADGTPKDRSYVQHRIQGWVNRWKNNDAFSALRVELKDGTFIGHVVLGYGEEEGHSELAYLFKHEFWNQHYGSEAVAAVVNDLALEIISKGYPVNKKHPYLASSRLKAINATCREDNTLSNRILEKVGFERIDQNFKWNNWRNVYQLIFFFSDV